MCGRIKTPEEWIELRSDWKIRWGEIRDCGRRYNVPRLTIWPVSKQIGNVKNEGPELVVPIAQSSFEDAEKAVRDA